MRWEGEAEDALARAGFNKVVERAGVDDYQGWGAFLAEDAGKWAVISWSYGSCGGCDAYEDMPEVERVIAFDLLVETFTSESEARSRFENSKGW